jgi:hypothetical protein
MEMGDPDSRHLLDVWPGRRNRSPTPETVHLAARVSRNQFYEVYIDRIQWLGTWIDAPSPRMLTQTSLPVGHKRSIDDSSTAMQEVMGGQYRANSKYRKDVTRPTSYPRIKGGELQNDNAMEV